MKHYQVQHPTAHAVGMLKIILGTDEWPKGLISFDPREYQSNNIQFSMDSKEDMDRITARLLEVHGVDIYTDRDEVYLPDSESEQHVYTRSFLGTPELVAKIAHQFQVEGQTTDLRMLRQAIDILRAMKVREDSYSHEEGCYLLSHDEAAYRVTQDPFDSMVISLLMNCAWNDAATIAERAIGMPLDLEDWEVPLKGQAYTDFVERAATVHHFEYDGVSVDFVDGDIIEDLDTRNRDHKDDEFLCESIANVVYDKIEDILAEDVADKFLTNKEVAKCPSWVEAGWLKLAPTDLVYRLKKLP